MALIFDRENLRRLADSSRDGYAANEPFPHVVFDDFLPADAATAIAERFPPPAALAWKRYDNDHEVKLEFSDDAEIDDYIRNVLYQFNSACFLQFLEALTGSDRLLPDPYFEGGGLHQIERGGFLDVHADFNYHSRLGIRRRLNVLVYFNRDWKDEYGGHLELWTPDMRACAKRILPVFNRCVIFSTLDHAFHGHPQPLACPPGSARRSLALYYYSAEFALSAESERHNTVFRVRPGDESSAKYSAGRRIRRRAKEAILSLTPPVALHMYEKMRRWQTLRP